MELLEDPSFKMKYQKAKLRVKLWESEFKKLHGRNPTKVDIREASLKVREAYKSYYLLKSLALQDSLMDITFSDSGENCALLTDLSENSNASAGSVELEKHNVEQVDKPKQKRTVLGDIQNSNDNAETEVNINKESENDTKKDAVADIADNVKDVWGPHLNKNVENASAEIDNNKKYLSKRSGSFHFSEKLFVGSKFSKRNPRKSRSFCKMKAEDSNDGFAIPQDFHIPEVQGSKSQPQLDVQNVPGPELQSPLPDINSVLSSQVKIVKSSPLVCHAISAVQKALISSEKQTPKRNIDKGWLERCTKSNSLEYKPQRINDSGIASLESSITGEQTPGVAGIPDMAYGETKTASPEEILSKEDSTSEGDSEEDVIENSESEDECGRTMRKNTFSAIVKPVTPILNNVPKLTSNVLNSGATKCSNSRKRKHVDNESLLSRPSKQQKIESEAPVTESEEIEIPKPEDIEKIAEAVVASEKRQRCPRKTGGKLTKKEVLAKKLAAGTVNDNFVRINIKKKVYVRGKKHYNFSKMKKAQWKKKKKLAGKDDMSGCDGGLLTCYKCGDVGHYARNCLSTKGDQLLPKHEEGEEEDSPFLTLEEVERLASAPDHVSKRKLMLASHEESGRSFDIVRTNAVEPLYQLNEDGTLMDTPPEVYEALERFGHDGFRPGQELAIMRILSGLSTLVTLSTGAGKSLCYQLPAYLYSQRGPCITLVVSPLVSLMEDQVTGVPGCLKVACLHTNQTTKQREKVVEMAKSGALNCLLVSPEAVVCGEKTTGFGSILRELSRGIAFACIDEAHCVSQWSHNFRPSYLVICKVLKEKLGVNTILGLTATATKVTCSSIVAHLGVPDGEAGVVSDIPLPNNLVLSVSRDQLRDQALISLLRGERFSSCSSLIVYCTRRDECERLASLIRTCLQDLEKPRSGKRRGLSCSAEPYHAGLSATRRKQVQQAFMSGQLRVVVATVAFGMGINKANIRGVIHYNMPRSFESYVQEVGRAGRDGEPAHCHLFLDSEGGDRNELQRHIYANYVDRPVVRKLLQRVFVPCKCVRIAKLLEGVDFSQAVEENSKEEEGSMDEETKKNRVSCPGHEVAFSINETVMALDLPEENISTMLCYLELNAKRWIKVLPPAYTKCKVLSYNGPKALKAAAKDCPPLAMAIALDQKRGISHDDSNKIEFPVVEVAAALDWDSGLTKSNLKNLEWTKVNERWRRSGITVEFSDLGFRVLAPGNLSPSELDEALDSLCAQTEELERTSLQQLDTVFNALTKVSYSDCLNCLDGVEESRSEKLKTMIREYFQQELSQAVVTAEAQQKLENEEQIVADICNLICSYRDNRFSGRAVARIFHGIGSPCYPAHQWGRCKFWRGHLGANFRLLCRLAAAQILRLK